MVDSDCVFSLDFIWIPPGSENFSSGYLSSSFRAKLSWLIAALEEQVTKCGRSAVGMAEAAAAETETELVEPKRCRFVRPCLAIISNS